MPKQYKIPHEIIEIKKIWNSNFLFLSIRGINDPINNDANKDANEYDRTELLFSNKKLYGTPIDGNMKIIKMIGNSVDRMIFVFNVFSIMMSFLYCLFLKIFRTDFITLSL